MRQTAGDDLDRPATQKVYAPSSHLPTACQCAPSRDRVGCKRHRRVAEDDDGFNGRPADTRVDVRVIQDDPEETLQSVNAN